MFKTLLEAKASSLGNIAGACTNSDAFLELLNDGIEELMLRGDWSGTLVPIYVCAQSGCAVFPRYVKSVRKINLCRTRAPIKSIWYGFMDNGSSAWWHNYIGPECYGVTAGPQTPVFQDIMGEARLVRAFPSVQADIDKTVTIFGVDNNGQPLRHRQADGLWYDGWPITLAAPYGVTTDGAHPSPLPVRRIDRVILDDMNGIVRLFAYNTVTTLLEPLGEYAPGETNPEYQRYSFHTSGTGGTCSTGGCSTSVLALVKLRFIPVRYDTDLVLVNNLGALKRYMQSLKYDEAGDTKGADRYEAKAIRSLNLQLRDDMPDDQMSVDLGELGGTGIGRQQCF